MPKLTIDGIEVEVPAGASVLQACEAAGKEIPRFCYHERLSVAGNCRMCLVEIEKARGPVASCAMPAGDGMVVHTDSDLVRQARAGVMEFLLLNHPLDCPICDQGGECDLQDQAMAYGMDHGRYEERKRAVRDKFMGPLIATHMTRCIHCTRCVRFMTEIAGVPELGLLGRGEHAEISSYLERAIDSEVSGNIIDLCPVGALTSRPYAFHARPWELRKTETIDVLDAVGTNIRVDARGPAVLRVLPRLNDDVNQEWLADKGRFAVDGLRRQRLDRCYIRREGRLQPATWPEAFQAIAERLGALAGDRIAALAGDLVDVESAFALKGLMTALGSPHTDCRQDGAALDPRARVGWLFNTTIAGIDAADACLLIGTHPRWEAPIVNLRLRERWMNHGLRAARIGPAADLTWPVEDLGESPSVLQEIADGTHPFAEVLRGAERPMLILGMGALTRPDGPAMLAAARAVAEATGMVSDDWKGFNVLHTAGGRVGALEAGFLPGAGGRDTAGILEGSAAGGIEAVWLLGADEIDMGRLGDAFVIFQGHHGDAGAHRADVILPGAAYTEKDATYVNLEGRPQRARLAAFAPGEAREDWKILRAASEVLGHTLPYDSLTDLRAALAEQAPHLVDLDRITPAEWAGFGTPGALDPAPLTYPIANYYMTDPISRASETMAECTRTFLSGTQQDRTGTDG